MADPKFQRFGQSVGGGLRTSVNKLDEVNTMARNVVLAPARAVHDFSQGVRRGFTGEAPPPASGFRGAGAARSYDTPVTPQRAAASPQAPAGQGVAGGLNTAPSVQSTEVVRGEQPGQKSTFAADPMTEAVRSIPQEYVNERMVALNRDRAELSRLGERDRQFAGLSVDAPNLSPEDRVARVQNDAAGIRQYAAAQMLAQDRGYGLAHELSPNSVIGPEGPRYFNPDNPYQEFGTIDEAKANMGFDDMGRSAEISGLKAKANLLNTQADVLPGEAASQAGLRNAQAQSMRNAGLQPAGTQSLRDQFIDVYGMQTDPATGGLIQGRQTMQGTAQGLQPVGGGAGVQSELQRLLKVGMDRGYSKTRTMSILQKERPDLF